MSFDPGGRLSFFLGLYISGKYVPRIPKKQSEIRMSFMAKIDRFFAKLTACYREVIPDPYEGVDFHAPDPYATGEKKAPAGYVVGGGYGG